jgi:hypothetical protein
MRYPLKWNGWDDYQTAVNEMNERVREERRRDLQFGRLSKRRGGRTMLNADWNAYQLKKYKLREMIWADDDHELQPEDEK